MVAIFSVLLTVIAGYQLFRDKKRLIALVKAALVTALLNAWFIIPFLSYSSLDFSALKDGALINLHEHSLYPQQIFTMSFKYCNINGKSLPGNMADEMPLSVGVSLAIGVLIFWVAWLKLRKNKTDIEETRQFHIGWIAFWLGSLSLFMASWLFPWEAMQNYPSIYKLFGSMQFPWRWLAITSVCYSVVAMMGINILFLRRQVCKPRKVLFFILLSGH